MKLLDCVLCALAGVLALACSQRPSTRAMEIGQSLYAVNCAICHGPAGDGDGLVGETMTPKASRLNDAALASRPDSSIFNAIKSGVVRDGRQTMPPAKGLSDEDVSTLVRYLRTLAQKN